MEVLALFAHLAQRDLWHNILGSKNPRGQPRHLGNVSIAFEYCLDTSSLFLIYSVSCKGKAAGQEFSCPSPSSFQLRPLALWQQEDLRP